VKKALFPIRIGGNPHEYPFSAALYNLSKVLPRTSSLKSSAFNPSLINISAGHLLAWIHANDSIDFVSLIGIISGESRFAVIIYGILVDIGV